MMPASLEDLLRELFRRYGVTRLAGGKREWSVQDFLTDLALDGEPILEPFEPPPAPMPWDAHGPVELDRARDTLLDVVVDQGAAHRDALEKVRLEILELRENMVQNSLTMAAAILYAAQAKDERDPETAIENAIALWQELNREAIRREAGP